MQGIRPDNAVEYEFQVSEFPGKKVVAPWNRISSFTDSIQIRASGFPKMAYLGGYRAALGAALIVDVREVKRSRIISTAVIAWEPVQPEITSIYTSATLDQLFQQLQAPWLADQHPPGSFSSGVKIPSSNTNLVFTLQEGVFARNQIQYELTRNGKVHTAWRNNAYANSFVWLKDLPHGDYKIRIRYTAQPQQIAELSFEITRVWHETIAFRLLAAILSLVFVLLLLLFVRQRRKSRRAEINKSILQLELKALYAQLNPHFVFNALSSIQALINKQDIRAANAYLSDFARLTRDSLVHSQKNEIALHEEIQTLDTYLKLEKLRFGFSYNIKVEPGVNEYETNIPALLLQPLVENAVKHGVAGKEEAGHIELLINKSGHDMVIILKDNGEGITEKTSVSGLGLKLTRDRISLLNQIHPGRQINLAIQNTVPKGARLTLTFNQWFDEGTTDRR
ncbi:hypothetical protein DYBT9623_00288 [Dyadobacter sp. CECT 9623]|uniref:Histidine kinase n=1 Tax=Dyadobacter linearis TaxID=2823330 RepID=A0ABN7R271_9BACT|nr:histidine kinase [Dyadobacter sp. CECT 9623]CAG5067567.1 hypothetical protein DYBT9623_00288 [Dyadobacter sp. CECT 9623]